MLRNKGLTVEPHPTPHTVGPGAADNVFKGHYDGTSAIFLNSQTPHHPIMHAAGAQSRALRLVGPGFQDKPAQQGPMISSLLPTKGSSKVRSQACQRCHSLKKKCNTPPNGPCERCSLADAKCERYAACQNYDTRQERHRGVYRKTRELAKTDYATAYKKRLQYIARVQRKTGKEIDVGLLPPAEMCAEVSDRSDLPDSRWPSPSLASAFDSSGFPHSEVEPATLHAGAQYYPPSISPNQGVHQANDADSFMSTLVKEVIKALKVELPSLIKEPTSLCDTGNFKFQTEQCRDPTASIGQGSASWPSIPQPMLCHNPVETNNVMTRDWFPGSDTNISPAAHDKLGEIKVQGVVTTANESMNNGTLGPDWFNGVNIDPSCPPELFPDWITMALVDNNLKAVPNEQALLLPALSNETSDVQSINDSLESEGFWIWQ